jgi:hypothetical protein
MRTFLHHGLDGAPAKGEWKGIRSDGKHTALIACPDCGIRGALTTHTIGDDGAVSPSVVCGEGACAFHEYITLADWQGQQ